MDLPDPGGSSDVDDGATHRPSTNCESQEVYGALTLSHANPEQSASATGHPVEQDRPIAGFNQHVRRLLTQPDTHSQNCQCQCSCHAYCTNNTHHPTEPKDVIYDTEWIWDEDHRSDNTDITDNGREVIYHKHFSNGTAAIRGNQPMSAGQHYWEIKMTTSVYGTDMMIGLGTANIELDGFSTAFVSMLGRDSESWGLSYSGEVMHNGSKRRICKRFGEGMTIGIHLDMWLGRISFFKNGKYLGVAFSHGIRGKVLYPMACSTAARTGMRVVRSCSFPTRLEFMCCQALRKCVRSDLKVTRALSLAPGLSVILENNLDWLLRPYPPENNISSTCSLKKRSIKCIHEQVPDKQFPDSKKSKANDHNIIQEFDG